MILKFILLMLVLAYELRADFDLEKNLCVLPKKTCNKDTLSCGLKCHIYHSFPCGSSHCTNSKRACKLYLADRVINNNGSKIIDLNKIKNCSVPESNRKHHYDHKCLSKVKCDFAKILKTRLLSISLIF
jgi:hypothetical protein